MGKKPLPMPQSWVVRMRCVVEKQVVVHGCTEEQARNTPWDYAYDEMETDQMDWAVLAVEPNE